MQFRSFKTILSGVFIILGTLQIVAPTKSQAYEVDTHFYDTYKMARQTGFTHPYALYIAIGAQWVDEGMSSTPMGDLIYGTMLSRSWHFPSYSFGQDVANHGHANFQFISIAEFNHPVAHRLFYEGINEGNWMKMALSIHVVEDTAGHAGYDSATGHVDAGHNPDRTWLAPKKYRRMTDLVFKMLVAMRQLAPDEALEPWALSKKRQPVQVDDTRGLQEDFWKDMEVLIGRNYFKDPRYTPEAVNYILRMGKARGYIDAKYDLEANLPKPADYLLSPGDQEKNKNKPDEFDRTRKDARTVLTEWIYIKRMAEIQKGILVKRSLFNLTVLDHGGFQDIHDRLVAIEKQTTNVATRVKLAGELLTNEQIYDIIVSTVNAFAKGHIPRGFDEYFHVQFEGDDEVRKLEVGLRIGDRRELLHDLYGVNLLFDPQTWAKKLTKAARAKRQINLQALDPNSKLEIPPYLPQAFRDVQVTVVTMPTLDQIQAWYIKNMHNLRIIRADIRGGSKPDGRHSRVKGYQSPAILNNQIASGQLKPFPTLKPWSMQDPNQSTVKTGWVRSIIEGCSYYLNR